MKMTPANRTIRCNNQWNAKGATRTGAGGGGWRDGNKVRCLSEIDMIMYRKN
jgi:hypothetical protein